LLEKAGFSDIQIEPVSGFFSAQVLKFNYFTARKLRNKPRILHLVMKGLLIPIWTINQIIAPILDRLDHKWSSETTGYYIFAKKKCL